MKINVWLAAALMAALLAVVVFATCREAQAQEPLTAAKPVFALYGPKGRMKQDGKGGNAPYHMEAWARNLPVSEVQNPKPGEYALGVGTLVEAPMWTEHSYFIHNGTPGKAYGWFISFLVHKGEDPSPTIKWVRQAEFDQDYARFIFNRQATQTVGVRLPPDAAEKNIADEVLLEYVKEMVAYLKQKAQPYRKRYRR